MKQKHFFTGLDQLFENSYTIESYICFLQTAKRPSIAELKEKKEE